MPKKKIVMLVGNGLNMDYRNHSPSKAIQDLDTRYPLQWELPEGHEFARANYEVESLDLDRCISKLKDDSKFSLTDYEKIEKVCIQYMMAYRQYMMEYRSVRPKVEYHSIFQKHNALQRKLALLMTHYSLTIKNNYNHNWPWFRWFCRYGTSISSCVSLNYDLLLEETLTRCELKFWHCISSRQGVGCAIFKPHGSINYRLNGISNIQSTHSVVIGADMPLKIVEKNDLLRFADDFVIPQIVLPSESTTIRGFCFIEPGFSMVKERIHSASHVYIVGISYWECDRPELDEFIDATRKTARITIVNPNPPQSLLDKIRSKSRDVEVLSTCPI